MECNCYLRNGQDLLADGQRDGVLKACVQHAAADPPGSPNLRVCEHLYTQGGKGDLTSCRGTVQSAWQSTSSQTHERWEEELCCPQGSVVATWYGDDSPHLSLPNSQPCVGGSEGVRQGIRQSW